METSGNHENMANAYRESFTYKGTYDTMLEIEQKGKTFTHLAKEWGVSSSLIAMRYHKAARIRIKLYIQAIHEATGRSIIGLKQLCNQLDEEYSDNVYVAAYLEIKYRGMLSAYRNGEPGVPQKYIDTCPLQRVDFPSGMSTKVEDTALALELRKKKKKNEEIASRLGVTPAKVTELLKEANSVLKIPDEYEQAIRKKILKISRITGESYESLLDFIESTAPKNRKEWANYIDDQFGFLFKSKESKKTPADT